MGSARLIRHLLALRQASRYSILSSSSRTFRTHHNPFYHHSLFPSQTQASSVTRLPSSLNNRAFTASSTQNDDDSSREEDDDTTELLLQYGETSGWEEEAETEWWEEEEDNVEPKIDDGGDGGGIVLQDVPWGKRALCIAREVLSQFGDEMELYAFKTSPRGYIYVRIDKLSNEYGCPSIEEIESYSREYKQRLEEDGAAGNIPDDLALEVSSPGAERLLKVPDDLCRFKDMPMRVCYLDNIECNGNEKDGVFFLDSIELELGKCVWKLADVKENRDPESKGRPLSRKRRDWRLKLPFEMHKRVTLYLQS